MAPRWVDVDEATYRRAYRARRKTRGRCASCVRMREADRHDKLECQRCADRTAARVAAWRRERGHLLVGCGHREGR
jgi:rRNA maturation endonuclease Nob1